MRMIKIVLPVLLVFCSSGIWATDYDLTSYLKKVEKDNADLVLARKDLTSAQEGVVRARSALLPSVAVQGSYNRNFKDITQPMPVAAPSGGGPLIYKDIDTNYDNELTLALNVNQTVFNATSLAMYQQAKTTLAMQQKVFEATRQSILGAAKKLYAQTQLATKALSVWEASEQTAHEVYTYTEMKYKAGVMKELDFLMAEVDWKSKIPAVDDARKNAELAMIALKNLAGIPLSETVNLTEKMENIPPLPQEKTVDEILGARPDYAAMILAKNLADLALKSAYGSYLPTVSASFLYAYADYGNGSSFTDKEVPASKINVTATIPLFAGGYRNSLVKSALIEKEKSDIKIAQKRDTIERDLTEVQLRMAKAQKSIESTKVQLVAAQKAHDLAVASYTNGVATQLTVSQAATQYDQAQLAVYNALYEYRAAYYDWEIITGQIQ